MPKDVPDWAVVGSFAPESLRKAIGDLPFETETYLYSQLERAAIRSLLQTQCMLPVFQHLEKFKLDAQEWREVIIDALVGSFDFTEDGKDREAGAVLGQDKAYFQEVAAKTYELFRLLSENCPPDYSALSEYLHDSPILAELLKILSLSTSAKWPARYHYCVTDNGASSFDFEEMERLRHEEMPWLTPCIDEEIEDKGFPPPVINATEAALICEKPFTRYIERTLTALDKVSSAFQRSFEIKRKGNRQTADEKTAIFLEPSHWQIVCGVLFGTEDNPAGLKDLYQVKTIRGVINRHRKASDLHVSSVLGTEHNQK